MTRVPVRSVNSCARTVPPCLRPESGPSIVSWPCGSLWYLRPDPRHPSVFAVPDAILPSPYSQPKLLANGLSFAA